MKKNIKVKSYTKGIKKKVVKAYYVTMNDYVAVWGAYNRKHLDSMLKRKGYEFYRIESANAEYALGDDFHKRLKVGELDVTYS